MPLTHCTLRGGSSAAQGAPPVTSTALLTPALVPTSISSFLHRSTHRMLSVSLLFPPELSPPKQQPGAGRGRFCAVQGRWGQQQLCGQAGGGGGGAAPGLQRVAEEGLLLNTGGWGSMKSGCSDKLTYPCASYSVSFVPHCRMLAAHIRVLEAARPSKANWLQLLLPLLTSSISTSCPGEGRGSGQPEVLTPFGLCCTSVLPLAFPAARARGQKGTSVSVRSWLRPSG